MTVIIKKKTESQVAVDRLVVDAAEAARMLDVSPRTVWQLTQDGKLPFVKIGRKTRYSVEKLRAYCNGELDQPKPATD